MNLFTFLKENAEEFSSLSPGRIWLTFAGMKYVFMPAEGFEKTGAGNIYWFPEEFNLGVAGNPRRGIPFNQDVMGDVNIVDVHVEVRGRGLRKGSYLDLVVSSETRRTSSQKVPVNNLCMEVPLPTR